MPITYQVDKEKGRVNTIASDLLRSSEIIEHFANIAMEIDKGPFVEVVDFSRVDDLSLRFSDLKLLRNAAMAWKEKGHKISVFIAPGREASDMLEFMWPAFSQVNISISICKSAEEAEELIEQIFSN